MASVDTTLYDVLNITTRATDKEIKTAYRRLAKKFHPDKNLGTGSDDKFKAISYAHEVLTDPNKKSVYDRFGLDGLQNEGQRSHSSPFLYHHSDILSPIFGFGEGRWSHRVEDSVYVLKVTLKDLYNGSSNKFIVNRTVICVKCKGSGSRSGVCHTCSECQGSGVVGYFFAMVFMHERFPCTVCRGQGSIVPDYDKCNMCRSEKFYNEKKQLEACVERGMKDNEKIRLKGQGNQTATSEPGDVVVILREIPHDNFKRVGNDLHYDKNISLTEALCGFSFALEHLDSRVLKVIQPAGECVYNGQVREIKNEGMPMRKSFLKGNLYITFKVEFPQTLSFNENQLKLMENILGPKPEFKMPTGEDTEEVDLHDYVIVKESATNSGHEDIYHEDEDEGDFDFDPFGGVARGVQCAQQ